MLTTLWVTGPVKGLSHEDNHRAYGHQNRVPSPSKCLVGHGFPWQKSSFWLGLQDPDPQQSAPI